MPGQFWFSQGMNAYCEPERVAEPVDARGLRVVPAVDGLTGGDRARAASGRCRSPAGRSRSARTRAAPPCAIGSSTRFSASPSATMSDGTGVESVQTPFSCFFGLVMKSLPPMQFSRTDQHGAAVLGLDARPRAAADVPEERVEVVLQRLRGEELAVGVGGLESVGPLLAPVDEVDGGLRLDADRARRLRCRRGRRGCSRSSPRPSPPGSGRAPRRNASRS